MSSHFTAADTYKTVECQAWKDARRCNFGDYCRYAHGDDELRSLPPPTMNSSNRRYHPKYKTQRCNKLDQFGFCPYGDKCQFLHEEDASLNGFSPPSLRDYLQVLLSPSVQRYLQYQMSLPTSPPAAVWSPSSDHQTTFSNASSFNSPSTPLFLSKQQQLPDTYKTVECQAWKDARRCNFGDYCRYAHGYDELRSLPSSMNFDGRRHHPKYKTQRCNKLEQFGFCPYGNKCQFMHYEDDDGDCCVYTPPNAQHHVQRQSTPHNSNIEQWSLSNHLALPDVNSWTSPPEQEHHNMGIDPYDDVFLDQFQSMQFDQNQQQVPKNNNSNGRLPIFCSLTSKINKYPQQ